MLILKTYRKVALIEGVSYLLLLFAAMPLKYLFGYPLPVKYVGWAHGILFVAYILLLLICWIKYRWGILRVLAYLLASLIPFAPFLAEKKLKKEYGS